MKIALMLDAFETPCILFIGTTMGGEYWLGKRNKSEENSESRLKSIFWLTLYLIFSPPENCRFSEDTTRLSPPIPLLLPVSPSPTRRL